MLNYRPSLSFPNSQEEALESYNYISVSESPNQAQ